MRSPEKPLEEVLSERAFGVLVQDRARDFFALATALLGRREHQWTKNHFYPLAAQADGIESFLDDFGAKHNRTFCTLRELVASVRWFALAGFSLAHLQSRFEGYGAASALTQAEHAAANLSIRRSTTFVRDATAQLMGAIADEAKRLGLQWPTEGPAETDFGVAQTRQRLPRNMGQEDLVDEEQRIAEVASKYLSACVMFEGLHIRPVRDFDEREQRLGSICSEEQARVYEATVHNLQSTYDTHIKNTVLEGQDERLPRLRGHLSVSLHLLEAVTFLTHFVERHDSGSRHEPAEKLIAKVIQRADVQDIILNELLLWAELFMQRGRPLAEDLLPEYTNLQELVVELPDELKLHARPAALIVGIVNRYGTPVELEVDGQRCNAGSILEVLVAVGSHPEARKYVFRGDENPLRDIGLLFEHGLGERGLGDLPPELHYLGNN